MTRITKNLPERTIRYGFVKYESMKEEEFGRKIQARPDYIPRERREIEESSHFQKDNLFKQK